MAGDGGAATSVSVPGRGGDRAPAGGRAELTLTGRGAQKGQDPKGLVLAHAAGEALSA